MSKNPTQWRVVFYKDRRGKSPVLEFINGLPASDQVKIYAAIRLLVDFGTNLRMPHIRPVRDKIWELRPGNFRFLYFTYINHRFIILHGFRKTTNRTSEQDLQIAIKRKKEFLEE